jgi:hypothetical protein
VNEQALDSPPFEASPRSKLEKRASAGHTAAPPHHPFKSARTT